MNPKGRRQSHMPNSTLLSRYLNKGSNSYSVKPNILSLVRTFCVPTACNYLSDDLSTCCSMIWLNFWSIKYSLSSRKIITCLPMICRKRPRLNSTHFTTMLLGNVFSKYALFSEKNILYILWYTFYLFLQFLIFVKNFKIFLISIFDILYRWKRKKKFACGACLDIKNWLKFFMNGRWNL